MNLAPLVLGAQTGLWALCIVVHVRRRWAGRSP
jgi:hypothetical protein